MTFKFPLFFSGKSKEKLVFSEPFSAKTFRNCLILLDRYEQHRNYDLSKFIESFPKVKFEFIFYDKDKSVDDLLNFHKFSKRDFSFTGKMKKDSILTLSDSLMDVLIDFSSTHGKYFKKIFDLCTAKMKISNKIHFNPDLHIKLNPLDSNLYFKEISKYLNLFQ